MFNVFDIVKGHVTHMRFTEDGVSYELHLIDKITVVIVFSSSTVENLKNIN